jgi:DNA-binding NarL/FixJ family response regulator
MVIRVCIFEDSKSFRKGLKELFSRAEGFEMVGAFDTCDQLIKKLKQTQPDVILMDIKMPGMWGTEAVRHIRANDLHMKVVMQTVFEDDNKILAAISAGASGYILKNSSPAKFIEAVEEAYHGGAPMTGSVAAKVLTLLQSQILIIPTASNLTVREKEVLQLLVFGKSYKMIATELSITYVTVRFHMKNIYEKLHVTSMTEAVAKAIQEKII